MLPKISSNDIYTRPCLKIDDPDKAPFLIQEAEHAIIERARGLFRAWGDIIQEEEALRDGLYALRELKRGLAATGQFAEAAGQVTDSKNK